MTDKVQKIKEEIERLINDKSDGKHVAKADIIAPKGAAYLDILNFINSLPEEPASEDLEEELHNFLIEHGPMATLERCAKHFAKWQKQQMMKDAIESVSCTYSNKEGTFLHIKQGIDTKDGDKVKILIVKED